MKKTLRTLRTALTARLTAGAFTLVEMLIVIAVIGILMGLLLPVLGRARAEGRRIKCVNNLSQIGQALQIYGNHYGEYLPSYPGWGQPTTEYAFDGAVMKNYPGHQGVSRHMVVGYGGAIVAPETTLVSGRLNFMPVGLGYLVVRSDLGAGTLMCPDMTGTVPVWFNGEQYEYTTAISRWMGRHGARPLVTSDGRKLKHTPVSGALTVTAMLSSYSYRNTPFYCRLTPDNAPAGWAYASDDPDLSRFSGGGKPWVATWTFTHTRPNMEVDFMTPPFKTYKRLGGRAIVSDSFNGYPHYPDSAIARYHHREGYNVLFGDGHADWHPDEDAVIELWSDWADPANPGTDNLSIASMSSEKVWHLFDQTVSIDAE